MRTRTAQRRTRSSCATQPRSSWPYEAQASSRSRSRGSPWWLHTTRRWAHATSATSTSSSAATTSTACGRRSRAWGCARPRPIPPPCRPGSTTSRPSRPQAASRARSTSDCRARPIETSRECSAAPARSPGKGVRCASHRWPTSSASPARTRSTTTEATDASAPASSQTSPCSRRRGPILDAARRLHGPSVDAALRLLAAARAGRPGAALPRLLGWRLGGPVRRAACLGVALSRAARRGRLGAVFFPDRASLARRYGVCAEAPLLPLLYVYRPLGGLLRVLTGR